MPNNIFPIYRKTANNKSYYKLDAADEMTEIQLLGSKFLVYELKAKILPERNLLQDLIENNAGHWLKIKEEEYQDIYQRYLKDKNQ